MAFIRSLNLTLGPAPPPRQGIVPSLTGRSDPYRNPITAAVAEPFVKEVQAALKAIGREVELFSISSSSDLDAAFATFAQKGADAFLYSADPIFYSRRVQMVMLAVRYGMPGIYTSREYAEAGGLMSYGQDNADHIRQTAVLVGRILKGRESE